MLSSSGRRLWVLILALVLGGAGASLLLAQEVIRTRARGVSPLSAKAAKEKALSNAVREAAGIVLQRQTKVSDFKLISDAIYSRATGYVQSYKVSAQGRDADGIYYCKVYAEVVRGKIDADFLAIQLLIKRMGKPRLTTRVKTLGNAGPALAAWLSAEAEGFLHRMSLSMVHGETRSRAIELRRRRAVAAGKYRKATQLGLLGGVPYEVIIEATSRQWTDWAYNIKIVSYKVDLAARIVRSDTGDVLGVGTGTGLVKNQGGLGTVGLQDACKQAVSALFPKIVQRVLAHWVEDLDVGRAIIVYIYDAPFDVVSALAERIRKLGEGNQVELRSAPADGIGVLRVIGRVTAADIAGAMPGWTGGRYVGNTEGEYAVTVEPATAARRMRPVRVTRRRSSGVRPGDGGRIAEPAATVPMARPRASSAQAVTAAAEAAREEAGLSGRSDSPEPASGAGEASGSRRCFLGGPLLYVLAAVIVGGFLMVGIVLAALILRKK